jgi:hypothetical protein
VEEGEGERSVPEMRAIPIRDARTDSSLVYVNFSMWRKALNMSVNMELVLERIVEEETVVYSRQYVEK